jgi:hypothetical protein
VAAGLPSVVESPASTSAPAGASAARGVRHETAAPVGAERVSRLGGAIALGVGTLLAAGAIGVTLLEAASRRSRRGHEAVHRHVLGRPTRAGV